MTARDDLIPENLGAKHTIRVEDLRDWHVLQVTCANCGHTGLIYPARIRKQSSGWQHIIHIAHSFKCIRCMNRQANEWQVYRIPREA